MILLIACYAIFKVSKNTKKAVSCSTVIPFSPQIIKRALVFSALFI